MDGVRMEHLPPSMHTQ